MQPQPTDADIAVVLRGDGEPQTAQGLLRRLQAFEDAVGIAPDSFARGGTVERLEQCWAKKQPSSCPRAPWPTTWRYVACVAPGRVLLCQSRAISTTTRAIVCHGS